MKRNDLLTPEGTRDFLFEECAAKRLIMQRLTDMFEKFGYSEVMTPGIEFCDVFDSEGRSFPQEMMYKLVDGKNRLMVLRPDNTLPIARLCATRLRDEKLPLKLYYNQNIFMVNPKDSGRDDEISQCGIEIIGGEEESMDNEALYLAWSSLYLASEGECRLEIGDSGIFRELMEQYRYSDEQTYESIRKSIENKNYPALDQLFENEGSDTEKALKMLPRLFGGKEVFDKAKTYFKGEKLEVKLERLERLYNDLTGFIPPEKISVDLGLVHKKEYYTGIIFRGYVEGYGKPALSGGRYDALIETFGGNSAKAVGFAVNVEAAAKVLLKSAGGDVSIVPDVLVVSDNKLMALEHCDELISYDLYCCILENVSREEALEYAENNGMWRVDIVDKNGNVEKIEVKRDGE